MRKHKDGEVYYRLTRQGEEMVEEMLDDQYFRANNIPDPNFCAGIPISKKRKRAIRNDYLRRIKDARELLDDFEQFLTRKED